MQFWPGVRPNQRQRALGNFLYRYTVGRTISRHGQRLLDRYGNYTVHALKKLGTAAGALPGNTTGTKKMAYRRYGARTRRRAGGSRKRWVRRSYVGRKRRGLRLPKQLSTYIKKLALSGKEKLHVSYAGDVPTAAHAPVGSASSVWVAATSMNEMGAFQLVKNSDYNTGDEQTNFSISDTIWGSSNQPSFVGDYVFIRKSTCTFEITLADVYRNLSVDDPSSIGAGNTNFPWIVRMIVYKPKDSQQPEGEELFRTLNGDKVGLQSYRDTAVNSELEEQQLDARNMITKGILNKQDFRIVKDIRFQLGAGNVASCVSKKIPITFSFNRNEKIINHQPLEPGVLINLADEDDAYDPNPRRARFYDYRFAFFAVPSSTGTSIASASPINVTYHGVTSGHD